jgi:hypothetical protein
MCKITHFYQENGINRWKNMKKSSQLHKSQGSSQRETEKNYAFNIGLTIRVATIS